MKKVLSILLIGLVTLTSNAQKELTLEDAVMNQYRAYYPESTIMVKWIPNTSSYSFLSKDYQTLKKGNIKNSSISEIVTVSQIIKWTGEELRWLNISEWKNQNEFYIKVGNSNYIINISTKTATKVNTISDKAQNEEFNVVSGITAYTIGNDLYISKSDEQVQITSLDKEIVSGQAIARSEFGISGGIFWSKDGKKLAFYQKDESMVADYPLLNINETPGKLNSIKYPMAGQDSEKSKVGIYNVANASTVYITPRGAEDDYLTNVSWGPNGEFIYIAEVNRDQNHMQLQKYDSKGNFIKTLFEEKHDTWSEPEHGVYFVNNNEFVWINEIKTGFPNLYLYNSDGKLIKQLTDHNWVVQDIVGHDLKGNVYYKGTGESPLETNYFKVNYKTGFQCDITEMSGSHKVVFNSDFRYMFDSYSSITIPNQEIIYDVVKRKKVKTLMTADNPYKDIKIGTCDYGTIKAADSKTDLYYRLIKPSNFDKNKKYPVLVYVYGGPHAQMVKNNWLGGASLWMYWMAEQGYLVYTVDNRGSGNRGFEFENVIHRHCGDNEMDDQLKGVDFLKSKSYVDANRIAVHGWSYGGFMATSLMLRHPGVFTTGIAGGPVTDWKYYEIMYGERYMDNPKDNKEGYEKAALNNYVANLEGKLLLIHGTSDNVVVMQHNLNLVQAFVEAGVQMDFFPYPMHEHNVRGKDRVHLMRKVLTYVIQNNK